MSAGRSLSLMEKRWRRLWKRFGEGLEKDCEDVRTSKVSRRDREGRAKGFKDFQIILIN